MIYNIQVYLNPRWHLVINRDACANLATNFQDLVAKEKNLVALAPVLGTISCPATLCSVVIPGNTIIIFPGSELAVQQFDYIF